MTIKQFLHHLSILLKPIYLSIFLPLPIFLYIYIIVNNVDDSVQHIEYDTEDNNKVLMWRIIDKSTFIVVVDSRADYDEYYPVVEEALELIEQVCILSTNLEAIDR